MRQRKFRKDVPVSWPVWLIEEGRVLPEPRVMLQLDDNEVANIEANRRLRAEVEEIERSAMVEEAHRSAMTEVELPKEWHEEQRRLWKKHRWQWMWKSIWEWIQEYWTYLYKLPLVALGIFAVYIPSVILAIPLLYFLELVQNLPGWLMIMVINHLTHQNKKGKN